MIRPHPPRLRMKRRKTVSVTPAMGARTVAGAIVTVPIARLSGTGSRGTAWRTKLALSLSKGVSAPNELVPHELSQNFFTVLFYLAWQNESPRRLARADFSTYPCRSAQIRGLLLRQLRFGGSRRVFRVLAAEALHAPGGIHQ